MTELIIKTRDALIQAGISPKKSLSQNFLINKDVLQRQVDYANVTQEDTVLEIGGGIGVLTELLVRKAQKVLCIEYDRKLAKFLENKFKSYENIEIIHADILKIDLPKANKIVANLPYHISSPITFKILDYDFDLAVLMYQHEFSIRMVAKPRTNDYSRLSANLQYQATVRILERVPKGYFYPIPKVDSALVEIKLLNKELPVAKEFFRKTSLVLFNTKNKLVSTIIYDYFKRELPKEDRLTFRRDLESKLTFAKTRVRELLIEDLVLVTRELVEFLETKPKLLLY